MEPNTGIPSIFVEYAKLCEQEKYIAAQIETMKPGVLSIVQAQLEKTAQEEASLNPEKTLVVEGLGQFQLRVNRKWEYSPELVAEEKAVSEKKKVARQERTATLLSEDRSLTFVPEK